MSRPKRLLLPGVSLVALGTIGLFCGCKCNADHPYTPFGVTSASATGSASAATSPSGSVGPDAVDGGFPVRKADLAPRKAKRWQIGSMTIEAPEHRVLEQGIAADFEGKGESAVVAWAIRDETAATNALLPPGELWLYTESAPPRPILPIPPFIPTGPGCKHSAHLQQTGPHSLTLEVRAQCETRLVSRAPTGALVVLSPFAESPVIQMLKLADPAPGEAMAFAVHSDDRDGDGRDDAYVEVSFSAGASKPANAGFSWFDRAAGASRDNAEPGRSLIRAAQREGARAKAKKTAPDVLERVALLRRMAGSLCGESTTARIFERDGAVLHCGNLGGFVDGLGSAEIEARLALGNVTEAFAAHARDGWYFARMSEKARAAVEKALLTAVTKRASKVLALSVRPLEPPRPRWSPLAYDGQGILTVETADGPVRVGADGAELPKLEGDEAPPARALAVTDNVQGRWTGVTYSCDRSEIALTLSSASGDRHAAARAATRNVSRDRSADSEPFPLAFQAGVLRAFVGGSEVGAPGGTAVPAAGSPRSPDSRWLVLPTRLGLLLTGDRTELLQLGEGSPKASELTDCVVANDRSHVACLAGPRAITITPE